MAGDELDIERTPYGMGPAGGVGEDDITDLGIQDEATGAAREVEDDAAGAPHELARVDELEAAMGLERIGAWATRAYLCSGGRGNAGMLVLHRQYEGPIGDQSRRNRASRGSRRNRGNRARDRFLLSESVGFEDPRGGGGIRVRDKGVAVRGGTLRTAAGRGGSGEVMLGRRQLHCGRAPGAESIYTGPVFNSNGAAGSAP